MPLKALVLTTHAVSMSWRVSISFYVWQNGTKSTFDRHWFLPYLCHAHDNVFWHTNILHIFKWHTNVSKNRLLQLDQQKCLCHFHSTLTCLVDVNAHPWTIHSQPEYHIRNHQNHLSSCLIYGVHPKMSPFSTCHLIWLNYKFVSQLFQPILLSFSYWNSSGHNLVTELCRALKNNIFVYGYLVNWPTV